MNRFRAGRLTPRISFAGSRLFLVCLLFVLITAPAGASVTVTGITPATGASTTTVPITNLAGTGFSAGASVMLTPVNSNPVHTGNIIDGTGGALLSAPYGVFVSGNYAYVASSSSNALEIVDISNPAAPSHKGSITDGAGGALLNDPGKIAVSGNYAYVTSQGSDALEIVDISNPAAPSHKGSITNGAGGALLNDPGGVYVSGNYAYVASYNSNALEIIDISNPAAPSHKGSIIDGAGGALLSKPLGVYVSGNYAYVTSEDSNALEIVDISNPAAPSHKGNIIDGVGGALLLHPANVYVAGTCAYVSSYGSNALEIIDISDPAAPVHKGSIIDGAGGAVLWGPINVYVSGNYAYVVSCQSNALEIVDISNPAAPVHKGSIANGAGGAIFNIPYGIYVSGNYAFVTSPLSDALEIVDTGTVTATGVNIASATQITGTFDLTSKIAGFYNVVVTDPDGSFGVLAGGFTVNEPVPVADFTAVPFAGPAPMTVQFTDTSTNSPTSWSWDFGDGHTSVLQNPTNLYPAIGDYTVSLTATNAGGANTKTKTNYIRVYAAPTGTVPSIVWQKSLGGSAEDDASGIAQTSDGGYIVVGQSNSNDGDVSGNHGGFDCWAVRLDSGGNIVWQKSLGGSEWDEIYDVTQTSDGGYIVVGQSNSNDGDVSGHHGTAATSDLWVVRLDASGNIVWQKSLGGSGDEYGYSIRQTSDGGFIVAGDSDSLDGDVSGNHGGADFWVVKLDSGGGISWQKSLGGSGYESASSVRQTSDGGYIVSGYSESADGEVSGHHGTTATGDLWVVKLDSGGSISWQKSYGGTGDEGGKVRQTSDGGYIIGGASNSDDGDVSGSHGNDEYWVVRLDSGGNLVWQKSYGGSGLDCFADIQTTSDGGSILIGYTSTQDGDVQGSHGDNEYWTVRLDSTGTIIWQRPFGGSNEDDGQSVWPTSDGGYVLAGGSKSSDGDATGNNGDFDYWIVKLEGVGTTPVVNTYSGSDSSSSDSPAGGAPAAALAAPPALAPVAQQQQQQQQQLQAPAQQQQPGPAPVVEELSPETPAQVEESYPMGFDGLSFNADNQNTLSVDLTAASESGAQVTQFFDRVEIYQHSSPGVRIAFYGSNFTIRDRKIIGKVDRAEFRTDPITGNITQGNVTGSVRADLTALTTKVAIDERIRPNASAGALSVFQTAASTENLDIAAVAFTLDVTKVNFTQTGSANITMTVPASWVERQGGRDVVRIGRIPVNTSDSELLATRYLGTDETGALKFEAFSPRGTSVFGMLAVKAQETKATPTPTGGEPAPVPKTAVTTITGMFVWIGMVLIDNLLVAVPVTLLVIAFVVYAWRQKRQY